MNFCDEVSFKSVSTWYGEVILMNLMNCCPKECNVNVLKIFTLTYAVYRKMEKSLFYYEVIYPFLKENIILGVKSIHNIENLIAGLKHTIH